MKSRSDTAYALLGILALAGPSSGYDLRRFISSSIAFFWDASFAQIYELLRRLETDGMVSAERVAQAQRPDKLVYSLTEDGRAAFARWAAGPVTRPVHRMPFLLRVFFFDALPVSERQRLISSEIELHRGQLAAYREIAATVPTTAAFPYETLRFGVEYEELYVRWLGQLADRMEADSGTGAPALARRAERTGL